MSTEATIAALTNQFILDHIAATGAPEEQAKEAQHDAHKRLELVFGEGAADAFFQLLSEAIFVGFTHGVHAPLPESDRATILASHLRRAHEQDMFHDCIADGDPFPCRTIRALDLVVGPAEADGLPVAEATGSPEPAVADGSPVEADDEPQA